MSSKVLTTNTEASLAERTKGGRLPWHRHALFFLPCLIGLTLDLVTKWYMFRYHFDPVRADPKSEEYASQIPHWWISDIFGIQTATNPGALFGLGQGYQWLFALVSILLILGFLVWLYFYGGIRDRWLTLTLGIICGGAMGNFYDRVGFGSLPNYPVEIQYNVRDWILFNLDGVSGFNPWPNFNIADVCCVCGAIMMVIYAYRAEHPPVSSSSETDSDQS